MKTVTHPALPVTLTFSPAAHTYTDQDGDGYTPVTTIVKSSFPPFDDLDAATRVASRTGRLEMDILAEWRSKRESSAAYGTRVHAYAEAIVAGSQPPAPKTDSDRRAFAIVDRAVTALAAQYEFLPPEQIIFDPLFHVAGTIDLPARNRHTGALAIIDWKTCEDITDDSYGRWALPPIIHVPDSKVRHYSLQLSIYAWLLTDPEYSAYPSVGEPVELALIHVPHIGNQPVWRPVEYMAREAGAILRGHAA